MINAICPFALQKAFAALCHSTHLYGRRLVLEWADAEETVETLRRKTAEHFHGKSAILVLHKSAEVMKLRNNFSYMWLILHVSGHQETAKGRGLGGDPGDNGDGWGCGGLNTQNAVVSVKDRDIAMISVPMVTCVTRSEMIKQRLKYEEKKKRTHLSGTLKPGGFLTPYVMMLEKDDVTDVSFL